MNGRREGKPLAANTASDPLLKQIFAEQERLNVSTRLLADLAGVPKGRVDLLRHPSLDGGKKVRLDEVRRLAEALDFEFPLRMRKR